MERTAFPALNNNFSPALAELSAGQFYNTNAKTNYFGFCDVDESRKTLELDHSSDIPLTPISSASQQRNGDGGYKPNSDCISQTGFQIGAWDKKQRLSKQEEGEPGLLQTGAHPYGPLPYPEGAVHELGDVVEEQESLHGGGGKFMAEDYTQKYGATMWIAQDAKTVAGKSFQKTHVAAVPKSNSASGGPLLSQQICTTEASANWTKIQGPILNQECVADSVAHLEPYSSLSANVFYKNNSFITPNISTESQDIATAMNTIQPPLDQISSTFPIIGPKLVEFQLCSIESIGQTLCRDSEKLSVSAYIDMGHGHPEEVRSNSVSLDKTGFASFKKARLRLTWSGQEFIDMKLFREDAQGVRGEPVAHIKLQFASLDIHGAPMKVLTIGNQNEGNGYLILQLFIIGNICSTPSLPVTLGYVAQPTVERDWTFNAADTSSGINTTAAREVAATATLEEPTVVGVPSVPEKHSLPAAVDTVSTAAASVNVSPASIHRNHSKQQGRLLSSVLSSVGGDKIGLREPLIISLSPSFLTGKDFAMQRRYSPVDSFPHTRKKCYLNSGIRVRHTDKEERFHRFGRWWCCDVRGGSDLN